MVAHFQRALQKICYKRAFDLNSMLSHRKLSTHCCSRTVMWRPLQLIVSMVQKVCLKKKKNFTKTAVLLGYCQSFQAQLQLRVVETFDQWEGLSCCNWGSLFALCRNASLHFLLALSYFVSFVNSLVCVHKALRKGLSPHVAKKQINPICTIVAYMLNHGPVFHPIK